MSGEPHARVEEALATQMDALRTSLVGLSNAGPLEEDALGAFQGLAIDQIQRATTHLGASRAYGISCSLIELIIAVSQRDNVELADELAEIAADMVRQGKVLPMPSSIRTKPLKTFATEPPVSHTVFVDESGSAAWEEEAQPVLTLVGVLVEDTHIETFDAAVDILLKEYGLSQDTEVHAQPMLSDNGVLKRYHARDRFLFLRRFIEIGLRHIVGFHYLGMLKPLVTRKFRRHTVALGLDAYTTQVLYFNLTLQAACLGRIALRKYRYLFDRTDKYGRDIRAILSALKDDSNTRLRLNRIAGEPQSVDSAKHRFVQFADVAGYFLSRHRQIEIKTFQPPAQLLKHRDDILDVYALLRPKLLDFVKTALSVDWDALSKWIHPNKRQRRKDVALKLQRKDVDTVAEYFDRMADLLDLMEEFVSSLEAGTQPTADDIAQLRKVVDSTNAITDQAAQFFLRAQ